jgi:hypothetical protein
MTIASRVSKQSAPAVLDPQLLAALATVAKRPVRKAGNPWGLRSDVATALVDRGLIEVGTASDAFRSWQVWKITAAGRQALADGDPE